MFKTIVGLEELNSGELTVGETVKPSYVDQTRAGIDPEKNTLGSSIRRLGLYTSRSSGNAFTCICISFGFSGADQQKLAGVLSGGERNRLNFTLTLKQGGNLLLFDEPTNDLDVETLSSLENALLNFPGCCCDYTRSLVPR